MCARSAGAAVGSIQWAATRIAVGAMCILVASPVVAVVSIHGPTTITASGSYVVMRDISVPSGSVITVAASNVRLDLAGHTLASSGAGTTNGGVITIASSVVNVLIQNGRILSTNRHGLVYESADGNGSLEVRSVEIRCRTTEGNRGSGILMSGAQSFRLLDSIVEVDGDAISVVGDFEAIVANNELRSAPQGAGTTAKFFGLAGGQLINNTMRIRCVAGHAGQGVVLWLGGNGSLNRVVGNTFFREGCDVNWTVDVGEQVANNLFADNTLGPADIGAVFRSDGNRITGNVVRGGREQPGALDIRGSGNTLENNSVQVGGSGAGISLDGSHNLCRANHVFGSAQTGIAVSGSANLIEKNQVAGPLIGLNVGGNANVYRGNVLRGTTTSVQDSGTGNTDAGDNVW